MKVQEIVDTITGVESRYNVDAWEIEGIKVWPLIRIENYMLLSYQTLDAEPPQTKSISYAKKILTAKIRRFSNGLKTNVIKQKKNEAEVVFLCSGITYAQVNGSHYAKNCDPIIDFYREKNIKCKRFDLDYLFPYPLHSPTTFIQPDIDNVIIKSIIRCKVKSPLFSNENWDDYNKFIEEQGVNSKLAKYPTKEDLRRKIYRILQIKEFFKKRISPLKPKLAFVECYYDDISIAYLLACKQLGVKTIDLQHGVQGDYHLAYGLWTKVPLEGYSCLPDYFWLWTEHEKASIEKWSEKLSTHKPVVGGNLFSNFWKNVNLPIVKKYYSKIERLKNIPKNPTVLLTLSPFTEALMEQTWAVVEQTQDQFNWLIRLHPAMMMDKEKVKENIVGRGINKFEIDQTSEIPLYPILNSVDLHITSQSSCVIEATEFGLQSIVTSEYGASLYHHMIEAGNVFFIEQFDEILFSVKSLLASRKLKVVAKPTINYSDILLGFLKGNK